MKKKMEIMERKTKRGYILTSLSNLKRKGEMATKNVANIEDFILKNSFPNKYVIGIAKVPNKTDNSLK